MSDTAARAAATPATTSTATTASQEMARAERVFTTSIAISAIRCTLTYVLIPFLFPLLGFGTGVGPAIGVPIGLAAIVANVMSIRRFHRADHRWKWPMTAINLTVIGLLVVLVVTDLAGL
jgi:hypothetical protein